MERTAEILDTATGQYALTGEGATFVGKRECEEGLRTLRDLAAGSRARFVVDWKDEEDDILETFRINRKGFRALTGKDPENPAYYERFDRACWGRWEDEEAGN